MTTVPTLEGVASWHTCKDGTELYQKIWKSTGAPKARLVLVHGFSDHCDNYDTLISELIAKDIEVVSFDQRGWGRSVKAPKQKGLTGPTSTVLADIDSILQPYLPSKTSPGDNLPLFLLGHSMGGQEVLHFAADPTYKATNSHIKGYILDAPYMGLSPQTKPSPVIVFLGKIFSKVSPSQQMVQKISLHLVSRDKDVQQKYANDPLCHNTGTLQGLKGMLERMDALETGKLVLKDEQGAKKSILITHGTADGVCDFTATKRWVENSCEVDDKEFKVYEGWYHQLHNEPGEMKQQYAADIYNWILARVP